jgi:hypothetical protein
MDDDKDKGVLQKTNEAVEEFAHDVKDVAKHMMDPPDPLKPGEEIVMMPTADYGMFSPPMPPQYVVIHHPKKSRAKKSAKKAVRAAAKKPAKKSSKKNAAKKWKSPAKVAAKKRKATGKKAVKKKAKKSKR